MKDIKVKFLDGTVIEEDKGTETFLAAIKKIGIEKVFSLELESLGYPLVTEYKLMEKDPTIKKNQKPIGDYWVLYGMNNKTKRELLRKISSRLGLNLKVESED